MQLLRETIGDLFTVVSQVLFEQQLAQEHRHSSLTGTTARIIGGSIQNPVK